MIQSSLTNSFRFAASRGTLLPTRRKLNDPRRKSCRSIALSPSHCDASTSTHRPAYDSADSLREQAKKFKYDMLCESLQDELANPYRIWGNYFEFCAQYGPDQLPSELHSIALRKCVPPIATVKADAIRKLQEGQKTTNPHMWEYRFQTIIRWIYLTGSKPTLDDFHFILEQFAVTGHFHGSYLILQEMQRIGLIPTYKTYGLCLQCAAHRLNLPCDRKIRISLIAESSQMCIELLEAMSKSNTPCTSVNLDLCIRLLKESVDVPAFEKLLEIGYGINLSYPDQPPLTRTLRPPSTETSNNVTNRLPFSTAALNTTIDILGKRKLLSRMIAAFETLSKPLDSYYSSLSRDFDDDDDWPIAPHGVEDVPPHAVPNITTYNFLIRHCAQAGSFTLARHYILEVFELDRFLDDKLRRDLESEPMSEVSAPQIAINKATLLPIFGLANRSKHRPLADWVIQLCEEAISRKTDAIAYFSALSDDMQTQVAEDEVSENEGSVPCDDETPKYDEEPPGRMDKPSRGPLDLDLDAPERTVQDRRPFNLNLHLSILRRDRRELRDLAEIAEEGKDRLTSRIKERLRRRIWHEKDIFLISLEDRVVLPKDSWKSITIPKLDSQSSSEWRQHKGRHRSYSHYFTPSFRRGV